MIQVLCVGLVVCDIPLRPVPDTIFGQDGCSIRQPVPGTGGDALNVAVALARLGAKSGLCGLVGEDANGDFILARLKNENVDVRGMRRHPGVGTAVSYILVEPNGERHFLVYSDMHKELHYDCIPSSLIEEADIVYFGSAMRMAAMDNGGTAALFEKAKALGKTTVLDACAVSGSDRSNWLDVLAPMLSQTDIFLPSFDEAALLTGKTDLPGIRDALSGFGFRILVVKLGARGCYLTDFATETVIPAFAGFERVDATGAGDSFVGGFLRGLLAGWDEKDAAVFANAVAGFNVAKPGATGGVPDFATALRYVRERSGDAARFPIA